MGTKTLMSVEEYLRSSFDPDCDYVDGEVIERNMGELPHGLLQMKLLMLLAQLGTGAGLQIIPEIRVQVSPTRFRAPDIAVWRAGYIGERIPAIPPFLAIEILSPEDRPLRIQAKIKDYLAAGVEWVWVLDPEEKLAMVSSLANPLGTLTDVLAVENPALQIPLSQVFDRLAG